MPPIAFPVYMLLPIVLPDLYFMPPIAFPVYMYPLIPFFILPTPMKKGSCGRRLIAVGDDIGAALGVPMAMISGLLVGEPVNGTGTTTGTIGGVATGPFIGVGAMATNAGAGIMRVVVGIGAMGATAEAGAMRIVVGVGPMGAASGVGAILSVGMHPVREV
jgi:hypothetical protein